MLSDSQITLGTNAFDVKLITGSGLTTTSIIVS